MRIISKTKIKEFIKKHPDSKSALEIWFRNCKEAEFTKPVDVIKLYNDADIVSQYIVFNIAHNKYRLIAVIHYNTKKVYIRHIMTHKEYDKGKWKEE